MSNQLHLELSLPSSQDHLTLGGDTNEGSTFFAYHIRRGDFAKKYGDATITAPEIWNNTQVGDYAHSLRTIAMLS